MQIITLTDREAGCLWHTVEHLINDSSASIYIQYGRYKHWRRSAYIGARQQAVLEKVYNQLTREV